MPSVSCPSASVDSSFAWHGAEMAAHPDRWSQVFSASEVQELTDSAKRYIDSGHDIAAMTVQDVPLPLLADKLKDLQRCLLHGVGARVLTGFDTGGLSLAESAAAFYAVGVHVGSARSQNAAGHLLGHVRDTGARADDQSKRIYQTAERQTFHTDSADVVGLLCRREAREGGDSLLVSTVTIYNEMLRRRPDLARLLFEPLATDRRGEVPAGEKPFFEIPVLSWHAGQLTGMYQRQYIESAQRFPEAARLTDTQCEALDMFDSLANDPGLHFSMRLRPGDMQFVYNHALLHDRTAFTDHDDPKLKRHLLRLWLAVPGDRELPDSFAQRFGRTTVGDRGGIVSAGVVPSVQLA